MTDADFSFQVQAVPLGMAYPHVPFLDILLFLTGSLRHIKALWSIQRTMEIRLSGSQWNSPSQMQMQTGGKQTIR